MEDQRFSSLATDPRFRRLKYDKRKVKIDKRFKSMFKDKDFKLKYTVDKRGRPINATTNENLKRYYAMSDSEEDEEEEEKSKTKKLKVGSSAEKKTGNESENSSAEESSEDDDDDDDDDDDESSDEEGSGPDLARGEGDVSSSSDEDEDIQDQSITDDTGVEHDWGELDKDAPTTLETTRRLAVCHMDWDQVKAADLCLLFNSFKTDNGIIKSITIYPSDFGMQRMKEEQQKGPSELVDKSMWKKSAANEDDFHRELLRKYEINRLKYYYAIIECDNANTASNIYDNCNGREYETSGLTLDLRFVPDEMTFDNPARDTCTSVPDASQYKPRRYANSALQNSKVELSWDKTSVDRQTATSRKYTNEELDAADLDAYLASDYSDDDDDNRESMLSLKTNGHDKSSNGKKGSKQNDDDDESDDDDDDEDLKIKKYRQLIQEINEKDSAKDDDKDMEITWELGVKEKTEKLVKKKAQQEDDTPWGKYLEKQKEKKRIKRDEKRKKKRAAKAAAAAADDDSESADESSAESADSDDSLPAGVDLNDPYFADELKASAKDFPALKKNSKKNKKNKNKQEMSDADDDSEIERKRREKAELALLLMDEKGNAVVNDSDDENPKKKNKKLKKKQKQNLRKAKKSDSIEVKITDPRFQDVYKNPLFNIDPSASEYKKLQKL